MTEQKVKEKKEAEEKVEVKEKKGFGEGNPLYYREDFMKRLETLYDIYQNYSATAKNLNQEFGSKLNGTGVRNLLNKKLAATVTYNEDAGEFFEDSFKKMKNRWGDAWEMVGDLINQYKKLKKKIEEQDDMEQALLVMKLTPTIIQIAQEIRKQLDFIQRQQEQIKINQTNLIYSPIQINQHIHKVFKNWIQNGYVKVLKKIPELEANKSKEDKNGKNNESK